MEQERMDFMKLEKTGLSQKVIKEIQSLAIKYDVDYVLLFGSRARGDQYHRSDIDIAFSGGRASAFIHDVNEETSTLLMFDVVDLGKPVQRELREAIEKEGIVLYEKI